MLDQHTYVQGLQGISVPKSRNGAEVLNLEERECVKSLCGQLLWVSNNTRPDIAYETSTICNAGKNATINDVLRLNKLVRNIKQEKVVVKYPNLGDPNKWSMKVFSDAGFGNLPDGSSQGGYVVFLSNPQGMVAPVSWQSKKLHRITKSTLASETLAVVEAVDAARLIQLQVQEMFSVSPDIRVFTDSKSLHQTVHTSKILVDKSMRIIISYLRQFVNRGEISMTWIDTNNQLADPLTKLGAAPYQLREVLESAHL